MTDQVEYKNLDQVRHMLMNPERDLGDATVRNIHRYLYNPDTNSFQMVEILYNTAIERLFLEILYNAVDNVERSRQICIDPGVIRIWMTQDTIRIRNEGRPISCKLQPGRDIHIPEFIFSTLLTGSNFSNNSRKVGGKFGIGAKATNIFSKLFSLDIGNADEKVRYQQTWRDNMYVQYRPDDNDTPDMKKQKEEEYRNKVAPKIEPYSGPSYTQITFTVDFARFYNEDMYYGFKAQKAYTDHFLMAFAKHCIDASATGNIPVYLNEKLLDCTDTGKIGSGVVKYANFYFPKSTTSLVFKSNDSVCMLIDTPDAGITISFVNGVINEEGGIHVDTWRKFLFKGIISYLSEKVKGYKPKDKDISDHISMFIFCRLVNPKYKSQTKDKVTSPKPEVCNLDLDGKIVDLLQMNKWSSIRRIEDMAKAQINALAKKTDGDKKKLVESDKLMDAMNAGGPESYRCTLLITEGDGAANFAIKGIENGGYTGALPLKGKLLNVGICTVEEYAHNKEIIEMKKALGLKEGIDYSTEESRLQLRYGSLVIMTDQDRDGAHIRMLVMNFFRWKYPTLLKPTIDGKCPSFVQIMETPYIRIKDGSNIRAFFYEREYQDWVTDPKVTDKERERRSRCEMTVFKGLGSSSDAQLLEAFQIGKIITPTWDEKAEELMSIAFDKGYEDDRKDWLLSWDSVKKEGKYASQFHPNSVSHLVTNQLCEFSWVNTLRSNPCIVDGLKECQRKVMTVVLDLSKPKKVSQIKGMVSDKMHYRYGDEALYRTIVGLGNYCVGSNNIPLVKGLGQYDSRLGKTAAPDRYIFATRSPILKLLFRKEDECILEYLYEGDEKIEPKYYYPILPIWAINGSRGIGTGFSTDIPAHNPVDIMKYIVWWLKLRTGQITNQVGGKTLTSQDHKEIHIPFEAPPELQPWYRNYQGEIKRIGNDWYSIGKFETIPSKKKVKDVLITEIPVTKSINTYIRFLKELKEKPIMKNWNPTSKEKCPMWISGYKSIPKNMPFTYKGEKYIEILPYIVIEGPICITAAEGGPLRTLGLIEKISDTNITLLDANLKPQQYGGQKSIIYDQKGEQIYIQTGTMNAIDAYCEVRFQAYERRRKLLMYEWKQEIDKLNLKKKFIEDVIARRIDFRNTDGTTKKKDILIHEITTRGYPQEFGKLAIYSLTIDGIADIESDIRKIQIKYDDYAKSNPAQLWMKELEELYNQI